MDVYGAKLVAREWVEANVREWPGLVGAHFVGGITSMRDGAPFPATKDVDLHLIFAEGSPALRPNGPFPTILEAATGGVAIEAGLKPVAEYASPEVVLANPEIAYHLAVGSVLFDPSGLLRDLQAPVRRDYARRQWVLARLEHEQRGLTGALAMVPMAEAGYGASGELNILGYTTTFLTAALSVATLGPPRIGGRTLVHLRNLLVGLGLPDLHGEALALLGVREIGRRRTVELLEDAAGAFDLAVRVRTTPHPFQHKLHPHLRPYFVGACRAMIDEGYGREALGWVTPFFLSATDVILADGPEAERPVFAARQAAFLRELGFATAQERAAKWAHAHRLYDRVFALAAETVATHPGIVDEPVRRHATFERLAA